MKQLIFTVTNDLSYDQRMQRICTSLVENDFSVLLVGRKREDSIPLKKEKFRQKRINCWCNKGIAFYAEYNLRLFFFLLFAKVDCFCAIDLDTILPNYFLSILRSKQRVYDAHELFTEQKEIVTRPFIHKIWLSIESFAVPRFKHGYTVNEFIKEELQRRYNVDYKIIRNLPIYEIANNKSQITNSFPVIIYQGAVNEGRSFETLIPAMQQVAAKLMICGNGNFFEQTKTLIQKNQLQNKVELKGWIEPEILKKITSVSYAGVTLFEATGLNQYQSLSNRFFDYIMAGIPQVCVGFPQYKKINDVYEVAVLIENTDTATIAAALNNLLNDTVLYKKLQANCLAAKETLNWNNEAIKLIEFWKNTCI